MQLSNRRLLSLRKFFLLWSLFDGQIFSGEWWRILTEVFSIGS